jgi:hypothetical protein
MSLAIPVEVYGTTGYVEVDIAIVLDGRRALKRQKQQ